MVPTETMFGRSAEDGTLTAVLVLTNPSLLGYKRDFLAGTLFLRPHLTPIGHARGGAIAAQGLSGPISDSARTSEN